MPNSNFSHLAAVVVGGGGVLSLVDERATQAIVTTRYRFRIEGRQDYQLDLTKAGALLRGAFGNRFRDLCCSTRECDCQACLIAPACPYARVFDRAPPPGADRLRNLSDIPRPYVLKPPLGQPGKALEFDMVLVGEADQFLPYFIVTWHDLAERGLGPGRVKGRLASVWAIGENGKPAAEIFDGGGRVRPCPTPRTHPLIGASGGTAGRLPVTFVTPTHLVHEKQAVRRPQFHQLIRRARDRVNALSTFFGHGPLAFDFKGLAERAAEVQLVDANLRWVQRTRHSSRTGQDHPLQGVVGWALYEGKVGEFLPLLRACEEVHVGKGAVFGQGWIEVEK